MTEAASQHVATVRRSDVAMQATSRRPNNHTSGMQSRTV
jgi:hypothetical protein